MAIAIDHSTFTGDITTGTGITTTSSTGNCSVIMVIVSPGNAITGVTDNKSNAYVSAGMRTTAGEVMECWYAKAAATAITTVTPSWTGGGSARCGVYDLSGADATNPLAAYALNAVVQNSSTTANGPIVAVNDGGGAILASINIAATVSISSPFTLDSAGTDGREFAHDVNAGNGSFTPQWTTTTSAAWTALTVAFKSASGTPILLVQKQNFSNWSTGTSWSVTLNLTTKVNDLMTVSVAQDSAGTVQSVSDNAPGGSSTYVQGAADVNNGSWTASMWYCKAVKAGATSVTMNLTATPASFGELFVEEWSGTDTVTGLDKTTGTSGSSTAPNSGNTATTTSTTELLLGLIIPNTGTVTPTGGTGYQPATQTGFSDGSLYKIVFATNAYSASATMSANTGWTAQIETFKSATQVAASTIYPGDMTPGTCLVWRKL